MIIMWLLFSITFLLGYYLGGKGKIIASELQEKVHDIINEKPKPGVVNRLTEEQLQEKHDPKKRGNLEAFNRFFKKNP